MDSRHLLIDTFAHVPVLRALDQLSPDDAERRLPDVPHSIAEIVVHMTFWQEWFCRRCEGVAAPLAASAAEGWPTVAAGSWPEVRTRFADGLERLAAFGDRSAKPIEPAIEFPELAHYTIGDALVHAAQHNSHHLGQIILLRQLMGQWPPPGGGLTW